MRLTFSTEVAKADAFSLLLVSFAILIFIVSAATVLVQRSKPNGWSTKVIVGIAMATYAVIVAGNYWDSYSEFVSVQVKSTGVELNYVGQFGKVVEIPRDRIDTILFGIPGKVSGQCYLRIVEKSGSSRRSASFIAQPEACKNMRAEVISLLHF